MHEAAISNQGKVIDCLVKHGGGKPVLFLMITVKIVLYLAEPITVCKYYMYAYLM